MQEISGSFAIAFSLIGALDADLMEIVGLSIRVSLFAVGLSLLIGLPAGGGHSHRAIPRAIWPHRDQ